MARKLRCRRGRLRVSCAAFGSGRERSRRLTSDQSLLRHLARNRIGNLVDQALNTLWVARPARTRPEELILAQGVDQRFNAHYGVGLNRARGIAHPYSIGRVVRPE